MRILRLCTQEKGTEKVKFNSPRGERNTNNLLIIIFIGL